MIDPTIKSKIRHGLLSWYGEFKRDLPWRQTSDPYAIWISEIMLQQTRVETVIPYYKRWMAELPTLQRLAEADQDQILNLWEGLGYYRRALNLHKASKMVLEQYEGRIPADVKSLESLAGIGRYTAGAIASIAFDQPAPILDGNIRRVFSRLFDIDTPLQRSDTEKELWQIAEDLVPAEKPGEFNQALMELGALICLPKNPSCQDCPLSDDCLAFKNQVQAFRPVRKEKVPLPHLQVTAAIIRKKGKYLLTKRPEEGLLGGMWEFPGGKQEENETLPETLIREIEEELGAAIEVGNNIGHYHHAYTHYKVTLHAFECRLISDNLQLNYHTDLAWVPARSLGDYPMGKLDRIISDQLQERGSSAIAP